MTDINLNVFASHTYIIVLCLSHREIETKVVCRPTYKDGIYTI